MTLVHVAADTTVLYSLCMESPPILQTAGLTKNVLGMCSRERALSRALHSFHRASFHLGKAVAHFT
jgi:hypothetical protein